jgi:hypothetical protein
MFSRQCVRLFVEIGRRGSPGCFVGSAGAVRGDCPGVCSEHTPSFEYTACVRQNRRLQVDTTAWLALSFVARALVSTKPPRRDDPCLVATCRGGAATDWISNLSLPDRVRLLADPREVPPPLLSETGRWPTVSDVFDSPQQSEDYRDMYGGSLTATRRPGFAGRPRASTAARSLMRGMTRAAASSFVPPSRARADKSHPCAESLDKRPKPLRTAMIAAGGEPCQHLRSAP